jgi:hypothetical protein
VVIGENVTFTGENDCHRRHGGEDIHRTSRDIDVVGELAAEDDRSAGLLGASGERARARRIARRSGRDTGTHP